MTPDAKNKRLLNTWLSGAGIALSVATLAFIAWWSVRPVKPDPETAPAVVAAPAPIVVRVPRAAAIGSGSADIATAMTSSIQTALVRSGIRVVNDSVSAGQAGNPGYYVETTLQRAGDRARAQVRLFRASTDSSLWADQLDFRIADSFSAQDSLSARVLRAVRAASVRAP